MPESAEPPPPLPTQIAWGREGRGGGGGSGVLMSQAVTAAHQTANTAHDLCSLKQNWHQMQLINSVVASNFVKLENQTLRPVLTLYCTSIHRE